jgi:hypothetical protein
LWHEKEIDRKKMAISQQILTILEGMTICMKRKFDPKENLIPKKIDYLEGDIIGVKKKWIPKKWQF